MNRPTPSNHGSFCRRTRREFLWEAGAGFTGTGTVPTTWWMAKQEPT